MRDTVKPCFELDLVFGANQAKFATHLNNILLTSHGCDLRLWDLRVSFFLQFYASFFFLEYKTTDKSIYWPWISYSIIAMAPSWAKFICYVGYWWAFKSILKIFLKIIIGSEILKFWELLTKKSNWETFECLKYFISKFFSYGIGLINVTFRT